MDLPISQEELIKKINELKANPGFDLSTEEDLSLAVMNLVSLEEHFYFTGEKTGKGEYFGFLEEVREIRKSLLARMMPKNEGETWCISKHLLAASMRLIEVGTKLQSSGRKDESKDMFNKAYRLYSLFWGLRLELVSPGEVKKIGAGQLNKHDRAAADQPWTKEDIVSKLVDCCRE